MPSKDVVEKEVEVPVMLEPRFITLTKKPANQVAFRIVRNAGHEGGSMSNKNEASTPARSSRVRAVQRSGLLYIMFPEGTTEEQVAEAAKEYGIEGYTVVQEGDRYCLRRSDLTETPADVMVVTIADGVKAGVRRTELPAPVTDPLPNIAVAAIDFSGASFPDKDAVTAYLERSAIDFLPDRVENVGDAIRVFRSELDDSAEVRSIEVEAGVSVLVTRAAVQDVTGNPAFVEVVSDTAYGSWGWGQLDFAARLADIQFSEAADEAVSVLGRVMNQILLYSSVPVALRKDLVARAAAQFTAYIGTLIEALPAKVLVINRSAIEDKERNTMSKKENEKSGSGAQAGTEVPPTPPAVEYITRADAEALITSAVEKAIAAVKPAEAAGTQEPAAAVERKDGATGEGAAMADTLQKLGETVTQSFEGVKNLVGELTQRMERIESGTVVRSDDKDGKPIERKDEAAAKDVFRGVFNPTQRG